MRYQDETIVNALIQTGSISGAAQFLKISPLTIRRRMEGREFARLYEEAQTEMVRLATVAVMGHLGDAFGVIHDLMHDETVPPSVRLNAASRFIDEAWRLSEKKKEEEKMW